MRSNSAWANGNARGNGRAWVYSVTDTILHQHADADSLTDRDYRSTSHTYANLE